MDGQLGAPSGNLPARVTYGPPAPLGNMPTPFGSLPQAQPWYANNPLVQGLNPTAQLTLAQQQPKVTQATPGSAPYWQLATQISDTLDNRMNQWRQGEKGNVFDVNNPILDSVVQRIAAGEAADLTKEDQAALEKFLLKNAGGATPGMTTTAIGTGSDEFMNTGFMQSNIANNVQFTDQLRWDPARKKYISVGKWMNDQKKRNTKKPQGAHRRAQIQAKYGGGANAQQYAKQPKPEEQNLGGGYGVVNFSAGLG